MSDKPNGGPAFPFVFDDAEKTRHVYVGMTVRDYLAARAMQALFDSDAGHSPDEVRLIARESYAMADAMIAERSK